MIFISYQILYLTIFTLLGAVAIFIVQKIKKLNKTYNLKMRRHRYERLFSYIKKNIYKDESGTIFSNSGLKITIFQYQMVRYMSFILWLILLNFSFKLGGGSYPVKQLFIILILFLVSSPKTYLLGKKTPFKYVLDIFINNHKYKKNIEIYRAISQLKNIALTRKDAPPGSDFVLEQLNKFTNIIRPVFNKTIALWSMGEKDEARNYLEQAIDTKEATELANILRKLDDLEPYELRNQLTLLQESIKKERETRKIQTNENISNLVYLIVITTCVIIMVNFVIVVYYIETINQLKFLN